MPRALSFQNYGNFFVGKLNSFFPSLNSESIQTTQSKIEDLYSQLKDLASEKQTKLDENLKLFHFNREIEDLKSWIADREVIASSEDIGQDFDNIQMIEERFDRYVELLLLAFNWNTLILILC